jgi:hypothetical protein
MEVDEGSTSPVIDSVRVAGERRVRQADPEWSTTGIGILEKPPVIARTSRSHLARTTAP